jgi:hypothetical protein
MTSNNSFLDLSSKQVLLFNDNNLVWTECLVKFESVKAIMDMGYNILVRSKKIIPIESMAQEDKVTLWNTTKDIASGRLDQKDLIRISKA